MTDLTTRARRAADAFGDAEIANLLRELVDQNNTLRETATALLSRIDNMTTAEFERGGERDEREALRAALNETPEAS